jgi:hypothetical protein
MKAAFSALDNSVKDVVMGREKGKNEDGINVLAPDAVSYVICAGSSVTTINILRYHKL